jgi:UDPglucose--hexose-1-phosphate uridylyltransferase
VSHRQGIHLADGRELFYYDRRPGQDRSAPDRRADLPPAITSSQVRWNPLFRDYSVIASHRQTRTYRPPADRCPLCPSHPGSSTEIPSPEYEVAVFENRFPSFSLRSDSLRSDTPTPDGPTPDGPPPDDAATHHDVPLFRAGPGDGRCEVVCFTSDHNQAFSQLSPEHVGTVIDAWADRTRELSAVPSIEYVFCFENRGEEIGVTLSHPHGQIYGYPFVPPRFFKAAESARHHLERTGSCLQCDLLAAELADGARVVCESAHWVCYVPFAARWPYEVRVVPRAHVPDIPALSDEQRSDLARVYLDVLGGFDRLFETATADTPTPLTPAPGTPAPGTPTPYIAGWQQAPVRRDRDVWHLAAEIFTIRRAPGKLKYLAGSESGAGVWINDIAPESAARQLRAATR